MLSEVVPICAGSLNRKTSTSQVGDSGATPTPALQFKVEPCDRQTATAGVEKWHYSHSLNGIKSSYCFQLRLKEEFSGVAVFGKLAMHGQYKRYVKDERNIIELRRFCCADEAPKNSESRFLGYCLRWLRKHTPIVWVLSYADLTYGHEGIIYQASNFKKVGLTAPGRLIEFEGRFYHDHAVRTKYKGRLKPFAERLQKALLSGDAHYRPSKQKVIYLYGL